jgi:hypothetical protein
LYDVGWAASRVGVVFTVPPDDEQISAQNVEAINRNKLKAKVYLVGPY